MDNLGEIEYVQINNIVIPEEFQRTSPKKYKMNQVRKYFIKNKNLDKPIILNDNILIDGYIRFLIAKELNIEFVPCIKNKSSMEYIIGKFKSYKKEYSWKNDRGIPIKIGDKVLVYTNDKANGHNVGIVLVNKVFSSNNPNLLRHKSIITKL